MTNRILTIPNVISLARLAGIPVLWWLAIQGHAFWVGIGMILALVSDIVDGRLARRLNQVTELGSKLDSLADNLMISSGLVWLIMLRPEVMEGAHRIISIAAVTIYAVFIGVGYFRFRRLGNLHLYSGKAAGILGALFVLDSFIFGFHPAVYYLAAGVFTLANCEGLLVMLTRSEVNEHLGSILRRQPAATLLPPRPGC